MTRQQNQKGFTVLESLLVLVIAGLIGAVGYKVYTTKNSTDKIANSTTAGSEQVAGSDTAIPSAVNSASDIEQAERAIDYHGSPTDDNADLSQLDSELSSF